MNGPGNKFFALILSMVMSLSLFAAGQQGESSPESSEPVVLTMLIDNQVPKESLEAVNKAFEEKTGIKVVLELRPGGAEGDNLLKTRLIAQEMTDLSFYNSGSLFMALNPQQYFVDLTGEPFMDRVIDSFKPTVSVDDKVYGVPAEASMAGGWFYNKKVYEKLGLEVPETWDELMANSQAIEDAGIQAVIASYKDSWTAQLLVLADYYNVNALSPDFAYNYTANKEGFADNAAALRGFEKLAEVYAKGFIGSEPLSTGFEDGLNMLLDGRGAHYPMLAFALPAMAGMNPEHINDIGFFPQPGDAPDSNGITLWMPANISISKDSKNIEAAKQWMDFFLSEEAIKIAMAIEPPAGVYMVKGIEMPAEIYPAVQDMLPYLESGNSFAALEFLSPIKGPNLPQICVEVGIGVTTPEEAAAKYDKDVKKQAKQLGLAGW